jgi:plastocyanin
MRTILAITLLLLAGHPAPQAAIALRGFGVHPDTLTVVAGTRITFTNEDDIEHTVTAGVPDHPDGRFTSALSTKGATFAVTLTKPGTYPFFCERHPFMHGEILVTSPESKP